MTFYITEYQTAASDQGRALPLGHGVPLARQTLPIGGGPALSQPFTSRTHFIRMHADAVCSFLIGTATGVGPPAGQNPVATTTDARMAANQTEYMGVDPGMLISVIANI